MPLHGTLGTMPLRELLRWLALAKSTGTLQVEREHVSRWVVFREGQVVSCSSDVPTARLGHFLLAQGRIAEDHLRAALAAQEQTGKQLGRLFVEMGALTDGELSAHLQAQAEESIFGLFEWPDAVFRFHEEVREGAAFGLCLDVEDVIARGEKRLAELERIRAVFPDHHVVLRHGKQPPEAILQSPMARHLFEAIDGQRSIAEILLHVHGSEFMVTRFLCELQRAGFVEIVAVPEPVAAPAAPEATASPVATAAVPLEAPAPPAAPSAPATVTAPPADVDPAAILGTADLALEDLDWDDDPLDEHSEILDIPDVFAESSDVEALEDSVAHQVDRQLATVREHLSANRFEEALIQLDELYRKFPDDDALRRLTAEAEASFKDKAYRHYVPAHMIPLLKTPLDQLESQHMSPTEFFLLSRIDGTWDVKSIIQVAPIREVEALITLKRMREQGVIELREPTGRD